MVMKRNVMLAMYFTHKKEDCVRGLALQAGGFYNTSLALTTSQQKLASIAWFWLRARPKQHQCLAQAPQHVPVGNLAEMLVMLG